MHLTGQGRPSLPRRPGGSSRLHAPRVTIPRTQDRGVWRIRRDGTALAVGSFPAGGGVTNSRPSLKNEIFAL
jgi:hypothetical protein